MVVGGGGRRTLRYPIRCLTLLARSLLAGCDLRLLLLLLFLSFSTGMLAFRLLPALCCIILPSCLLSCILLLLLLLLYLPLSLNKIFSQVAHSPPEQT